MNLPTKITFSRIILIVGMIIGLFVLSFFDFKAPVIFMFEANGKQYGINLIFLIICIIFLVASFTDFLDGHLARKNNQVTSLGKFLDPVADKLLINSLAIFLAAQANITPYNGVANVGFNVWCVILLVARDIVVDCLRFVAAQKNIVLAANIFGKIKTVLEMVAITVVLLNDFPFYFFDNSWPQGLRISDILVYLCTIASLVSGAIYVISNLKVFKENK